MPIMDGMTATKKIRELLTNKFQVDLKDQPVIIGVTGHVDDRFKKDGIKAGMNEIASKPLYKDDLKDLINKYYWFIYNYNAKIL